MSMVAISHTYRGNRLSHIKFHDQIFQSYILISLQIHTGALTLSLVSLQNRILNKYSTGRKYIQTSSYSSSFIINKSIISNYQIRRKFWIYAPCLYFPHLFIEVKINQIYIKSPVNKYRSPNFPLIIHKLTVFYRYISRILFKFNSSSYLYIVSIIEKFSIFYSYIMRIQKGILWISIIVYLPIL